MIWVLNRSVPAQCLNRLFNPQSIGAGAAQNSGISYLNLQMIQQFLVRICRLVAATAGIDRHADPLQRMAHVRPARLLEYAQPEFRQNGQQVIKDI